MSDVLCWMIPFLLFPLTASLTFHPTNYNDSTLRPRLMLPENAPYLSRDTNSSALNNVTSNITSGSQKFIWIIEDTYNTSNFFQWGPAVCGSNPDPTGLPRQILFLLHWSGPNSVCTFYISLARADPFPVEPSSMRLFTFHSTDSR
jgi:hypothetical protein